MGESIAVGEGRPPEADARKLITEFLAGEGYPGVEFSLVEDGESTWAWWVRWDGEGGDTTSYCYYNEMNAAANKDDGLCVEWYGTSYSVVPE